MQKQPNTKNILRWTGACAAALVLFTLFLIWFSPYQFQPGSNRKMIECSVIINRPAQFVFEFIHGSQSSGWMTYVDHVKALDKTNRKRYFCNADETGQRYDGTLVSMQKNRKVKLRLSNFVDFPFDISDVINEQEFVRLNAHTCKVSFKLYYAGNVHSVFEDIKARIAAWRVQKIFNENLNNIKAEIEEPGYVKY